MKERLKGKCQVIKKGGAVIWRQNFGYFSFNQHTFYMSPFSNVTIYAFDATKKYSIQNNFLLVFLVKVEHKNLSKWLLHHEEIKHKAVQQDKHQARPGQASTRPGKHRARSSTGPGQAPGQASTRPGQASGQVRQAPGHAKHRARSGKHQARQASTRLGRQDGTCEGRVQNKTGQDRDESGLEKDKMINFVNQLIFVVPHLDPNSHSQCGIVIWGSGVVIGQGTYSSVYKARDLETNKIVALEKVRFANMDPESVPFMAREIILL
ncbi:unnamed protein product [Lupinus luteus]|uniref:Protein kinase domain-containing protein n=1 Tax=Lupinus luteus TaxID=3873 RepID=A0AAV1WKN3_LUPLU